MKPQSVLQIFLTEKPILRLIIEKPCLGDQLSTFPKTNINFLDDYMTDFRSQISVRQTGTYPYLNSPYRELELNYNSGKGMLENTYNFKKLRFKFSSF